MSEMVERVARAMAASDVSERMAHNRSYNISMPGPFDGLDYLPTNWDTAPDHLKEPYIRRARAVLQAMREPTEAMCGAGANELFASVEPDWNEDAKRIYTAMLTAALGADHG